MPEIEELLEKITKTVIDDRGRVYIPKSIRRELAIKEGDKLFIEVVDGYLKIYTRRALNTRVLSVIQEDKGVSSTLRRRGSP